LTFGLTPVTPESNEDFALTAGTGFPVAGASTFPRYWQFQADGVALGDRAVTKLNFVDGVGGTFEATRGTGENSGVITVTFTAASGPEPGYTDLFYARFNAVSNEDEVGNWIYVLDEWISGEDTFIIDTTDGAPGSTAGSMNKEEGGRRFYVQAADNKTGGTTALANATDFNTWDFIYSIYFQPKATETTNVNLGGFNPGGAEGQAVFSLDYFVTTTPASVEARIADPAGAFYLFGEPSMPVGEWHKAEVRKTGDVWALYVNDELLDSQTQAVTFNNQPLTAFGVEKAYDSVKRGRFDEVRLQYRVP
jgi:hypothetical protein